MTNDSPFQATEVAPARKRDVLGIVALVVAVVAFLPVLAVFLIGLIPEMNAIWWLLIALLPVLSMVGVVVLVLAVLGIIVGVRRRSGIVPSIISVVLALLMLAPIVWIYAGSV